MRDARRAARRKTQFRMVPAAEARRTDGRRIGADGDHNGISSRAGSIPMMAAPPRCASQRRWRDPCRALHAIDADIHLRGVVGIRSRRRVMTSGQVSRRGFAGPAGLDRIFNNRHRAQPAFGLAIRLRHRLGRVVSAACTIGQRFSASFNPSTGEARARRPAFRRVHECRGFDAEAAADPLAVPNRLARTHLRGAAMVHAPCRTQGGPPAARRAEDFRHLMHETDGFADARQILRPQGEAKESAQVTEWG